MARTTKNNIKKKDEPKPVHTCGECGWGKFYYEHSNLDMAGNPICLKCPFVENHSMIRSEKACDKWKMKHQIGRFLRFPVFKSEKIRG